MPPRGPNRRQQRPRLRCSVRARPRRGGPFARIRRMNKPRQRGITRRDRSTSWKPSPLRPLSPLASALFCCLISFAANYAKHFSFSFVWGCLPFQLATYFPRTHRVIFDVRSSIFCILNRARTQAYASSSRLAFYRVYRGRYIHVINASVQNEPTCSMHFLFM